jgi:hypothetical protein
LGYLDGSTIGLECALGECRMHIVQQCPSVQTGGTEVNERRSILLDENEEVVHLVTQHPSVAQPVFGEVEDILDLKLSFRKVLLRICNIRLEEAVFLLCLLRELHSWISYGKLQQGDVPVAFVQPATVFFWRSRARTRLVRTLLKN